MPTNTKASARQWKYRMTFKYGGYRVVVKYDPPPSLGCPSVAYICTAKSESDEVVFDGDHVGPNMFWNDATLESEIKSRLDEIAPNAENAV